MDTYSWVKAAVVAGGGEQAVLRVYAKGNASLAVMGTDVLNARHYTFAWDYDNGFLLAVAKRERRAVPFSAIAEIRFRD